MHLAVLGPVRLVRDGEDVDLGTPKQRGLLAALALAAGRPVTPDALAEVLWGQDAAPAAVTSSLHAYVAGLRRALEPERRARQPASVLVTSPSGYALRLPPDDLDATRFADAVQEVRRQLLLPADQLPLPPSHLSADALEGFEATLRAALGSWSGLPYADLRDTDEVVAERARLAELRLVAREDLALVRLTRGEHAAVAAELDGLVREHPLREPVHALLVLALAGEGRQADALAALRRARGVLSDELGVDPGPALRALEQAVLQQDPRLQRTARPPSPVPSQRRGEPSGGPRSRIVGRAAELAALAEVLSAARSGRRSAALLVGEPGIGKSRLLAEVAERATTQGFAVLVGRCSRDEGAPPLWPWTGVLRDLDAAVGLPDLTGDVAAAALLLAGGGDGRGDDQDGGSALFRTGEAVVRLLGGAAARRPLLVVLDDLHWADRSSLRLLAQVLEDLPHTACVAVLCSRRAAPAPAGQLAEVGEVLVRLGARRLELQGLSTSEVARLVATTTGADPDAAPDLDAAELLRNRTEGNALFVVELVRLGAVDEAVPAAVTDVVAARLARLPAGTLRHLQSAAVLGRRFELDLLCAVVGDDDEDVVLDALDPALEAGLVVEQGVGAFRFSHALVADAVRQQLPATRRARQHAAAAAALEAGRGARGAERLAEAARHWLAAGPASAGRAWRAAAAAAEHALRLHAHDEAAALLASALEALDDDPGAAPADRYDLLMRRADACRWSADQQGRDAAQRGAVEAARALGDLPRLVAAAADGVEGVLWTPRAYGESDDVVVAALEDALRRLPPADGPLRCRALVALSAERYYTAGVEEREALAEEGVAMAHRLGDPDLLSWACAAGGHALWRPSRLERRLELAREGVALAEAVEGTRLAFARSVLTIVLQEAGDVAGMRAELGRATALVDRYRVPYAQVVLGWLQVPWLALRGRFDAAQELFAQTSGLARRTSIPNVEEGSAGAWFALASALGQAAESVPLLEALRAGSPMPVDTALAWMLVRADRLDDARAHVGEHGLPHGRDSWLRTLLVAQAGEVALRLRLPAEGARAYAELAPWAGRTACAGSGGLLGPVDTYLACAAAATGETGVASQHADDAQRLCDAWEVPVAAGVLAELRDRHGF